MSRVDRAFATPECHMQFSEPVLYRFPRGLLDHYQLLLGMQHQEWGWRPFQFLNCWLHHPLFFENFKLSRIEACAEHAGRFSLLRKLS